MTLVTIAKTFAPVFLAKHAPVLVTPMAAVLVTEHVRPTTVVVVSLRRPVQLMLCFVCVLLT